MRALVVLFAVELLVWPATAAGQPPAPAPLPSPGGGGVNAPGINAGGGGINVPSPQLAPADAALFLCPGVGAAGNALGGGGGYCDFDFHELRVNGRHVGNMHVHCEWGGFVPVVEMWNCWRVFPGQPDHPAHPDPDIIPDGMAVPDALNGPTPDDQWPPPGLAPAEPPPPPPEG
jgi:hypothetical protein